MPKRYRKLRGDTAYYPFAARTGLRARQRRHVRALRIAGAAALILAAVLALRQSVFRGGQPDAPAPLPSTAPAVTAAPGTAHVSVQPLAATRDALAETQQADTQAHTTPESAARPPAARTAEVLPRYRSLYEQNPDLIGWLRIDGTGIDLPVVQTPGDNEYYLRRGFDRFYAVGGTLFLDERCSVEPDAPTDNWLIYGHNMRDGSMFGQLVRYRDEAFCQAHPTLPLTRCTRPPLGRSQPCWTPRWAQTSCPTTPFLTPTISWTGSAVWPPSPKNRCMTPASPRRTAPSC